MLYEDLKPYIDPDSGLVMAADGGCDNEPLFAAIAFRLDPWGMAGLKVNAHDFLSRESVRIVPGLYRRYPGATDNSVDNLVGVCCFGESFAKSILTYCESTRFSYDVTKPGHFTLRYWFGRFVGFPPFVKAAAGKKIGIGSQILFSLACLFTLIGSRTDVGNRQLQLLMNDVLYGKYRLVDATIRFWGKRMKKMYPNGAKDIFSLYHGPNHPFVKYASPNFI
jgi:hypothetical protein